MTEKKLGWEGFLVTSNNGRKTVHILPTCEPIDHTYARDENECKCWCKGELTYDRETGHDEIVHNSYHGHENFGNGSCLKN